MDNNANLTDELATLGEHWRPREHCPKAQAEGARSVMESAGTVNTGD